MTAKGCLVARKKIFKACIGNGSKPMCSPELMRSTHENVSSSCDWRDATCTDLMLIELSPN